MELTLRIALAILLLSGYYYLSYYLYKLRFTKLNKKPWDAFFRPWLSNRHVCNFLHIVFGIGIGFIATGLILDRF